MPIQISDIIKRVAIRCGLEEPSGAIVGSTDKDIKILLELLTETGEELRDECYFPQLKKTHFISTTDGIEKYPLPNDFHRMISGTQWDQTNQWQMAGPVSDQEWNLWLWGITSGSVRRRFRVFGSDFNDGQFIVDPPPDQNAMTFSFEYIRSSWFLPKPWVTGESVTSGVTYRSASGNIYLAQTTGTTGVNAPSHGIGTQSDGVVNWLFVVGQVYSSTGRVLQDTDIPLIDEDLLLLGTLWRFREAKGFEYQEKKNSYLTQKMKRLIRISGAPIISMGENELRGLLSYDNLPESDFG